MGTLTEASLKLPDRKFHAVRPVIENPELLIPDRDQIEQYTLGHNFEKIETAEEFDGVWRDLDGSDEMEEQRDALEELKLRHFIRSDDPSHTTLETDFGSAGGVQVADATPAAAEFWYDEWDFRRGAYRPDYCGIVAEEFTGGDPTYGARLFETTRKARHELERRIVSLIQEKTTRLRLTSGDDIDFDAMIARQADMAAGVTASDAVYSRLTRTFSDLTLYTLMDISLSTDSFLGGRRIIDVEKEAVFAFAESLSAHDIEFGIGAFYSRTRNHCRFLRLKDFNQPWSGVVDRIAALEPVGYTRIGPALRHTKMLLAEAKARRRWIILITDGRPNDYDYYEGRYGIEDVRHAVQELRQAGVMLHTLAIGKDEKPSIPAMMGEASYQMLPDVSKLNYALMDFFRKAAR